MSYCMLCTPLFRIKALGREHMPVIFGYKICVLVIIRDPFSGRAPRPLTIMREVIICIYILKKVAVILGSYAASLPAVIKVVCNLIGLFVKVIIIDRFIDPYAPQHDARMISILCDHLFKIYKRLILPLTVSDMLPSGEFHKYQKSQLITSSNKIM